MADGKVVISTRLDNTGLEKGINHISGSLGGLHSVLKQLKTAIIGTFSARVLVNFCTSASKAAMQASDAMLGLQSIIEGQGRSFSDAENFLNDYVKDGLIPLTNATTAYKNLAMRGYGDSQIQQTLIALKDASAFGRQASLTMGEAVQSATEGLKNENSILVDNAGITRNVSKMWDDYAASIGTTASQLTQQQKIQAEVNGILAESKYQSGDAAKVAGTLSGQLQTLSFNFNNLKIAVGNIVNPLAQSFLPVINSAITALTKFASSIAVAVSALTGKSMSIASNSASVVADGYAVATDNANALSDATTAAGKAAKKSLSGFDELNVLSNNSAGSGTGTSGGISTGGGSAGAVQVEVGVDDQALSPQIQGIFGKIRELIEPLLDIDINPLLDSSGDLYDSLSSVADLVGGSLQWAWDNVLVPLAEWTIEDAAPAAIDLLREALDFLVEVIEALKPLGKWLWDNFLKPLAEWTGGAIIDTLGFLADALDGLSTWISENQSLVEAFVILVGGFAAAWGLATGAIALWNGAIAIWNSLGTIASVVTTVFGTTLNILCSPITLIVAAIAALIAIIVLLVKNWDDVEKAASKCWEWIKGVWESVSTWFDENIIQPICTFFSDLWDSISGWAIEAWETIEEAWSVVVEWFSGVWEGICDAFSSSVEWFSGIFSDAWEGIKSIWNGVGEWFGGIWEGIKEAFSSVTNWFSEVFSEAWGAVKDVFEAGGEIFSGIAESISDIFCTVVNGIIDGINEVIAVPFEAINSVLRKIKGIEIVGYKPFKWIKTFDVPQIPKLAEGAVLPANKPFLAMVGDQRHGTNVEAPLTTIQEAVALVMEDFIASNMAGHQATVAVLREILEAVLGIQIGDDVIASAVSRHQAKMAVVRGGAY